MKVLNDSMLDAYHVLKILSGSGSFTAHCEIRSYNVFVFNWNTQWISYSQRVASARLIKPDITNILSSSHASSFENHLSISFRDKIDKSCHIRTIGSTKSRFVGGNLKFRTSFLYLSLQLATCSGGRLPTDLRHQGSFFSFLWSSHADNHPQEDVGRSGYRTGKMVE